MNYLLVEDSEFDAFWTQHTSSKERRILFILRKGFDPRMLLGLKRLLGAVGQKVELDVLALEVLDESDAPREAEDALAEENSRELEELAEGRVTERTLDASSEGRPRAGGISHSAREIFSGAEELEPYTDVVVDVSAMPRTVYFPMVARLLYFCDRTPSRAPNVHLVVAEDPDFDARLREEGVDEQAHFLASFGGRFEEEGIATPKIWIPILGENRLVQFDRIFDLVKPDEVCGVLPSPSRDPRRADNIVLQYRRPLFEELSMDPRDFVYASERNPFDVYRQLRAAVLHYHEVFDVVGGCRVAISALSSKLMSVGALLVAYELGTLRRAVGVAHVDCQRQLIAPQDEPSTPELFSVYVAGEYDGNPGTGCGSP